MRKRHTFKKKLIPFAALATALMLSMTAYADETEPLPTDEFGNVIDWDLNGSSGEDNAGLEQLDPSESISETYSFEEQTEILQQMQAAETQAPSETGLISVKLGDKPESWNQNNICLTLYRGNAKQQIFLYRQSNWETSEQIPVGHYTVYKVETIDGSTEFHSDINSFDITANDAAYLTISAGSLNVAPTLSDNDVSQMESQTAEEAAKQEANSLEAKVKRSVLPVILAISGIGILAAGCAFYHIWKRNHANGDSEYLD